VKTLPTAYELREAARRRLLSIRGEPLFFANWERTVFIHYETEPGELQACVPFELDLYDGRAFVSVVAFEMRRMRPRLGGRTVERLFRPVTDSRFLNVRTYVRHDGEEGIYFMSEWLSNRISVLLGPWTFGLPYRSGNLDYQYNQENSELGGDISAREGRLTYHASFPETKFEICKSDSLSEFLLERYTAYTKHRPRKRFFRIWHEPWRQVSINLDVVSDSLLASTDHWSRHARLIGGNYSPGVSVWMGWPHRIHL
jgi:uncharacterized protein